MRTKPWPLILLAILQILSPAGTILFNAWALDVKPIYVLRWLLEKPALQIFESLFLMPIAGVAIYQMKAWSYAIFLAAMSWSFAANFRNWHYAVQSFPMWKGLLVYTFQILLAFYFMIPSVRKTYLDRSVRWWEAQKRFSLRLPVLLSFGKESASGVMKNISEGGILLQTEHPFESGQEVQIRFDVLEVRYEVPGQIRYALSLPQGERGYGVQFRHTAESYARFHQLIRGLSLIGIIDRDQAFKKPWYQGMRDWFVTLLKTGKGLTPEVKASRRN
jgi:Tfp pilus assembly protein PilZ